MGFLTNDKLVIVGAGGAIGSTMVQLALTMKLTPNVCLYDVYAPGMEGVMEEMFHCGYDGVNLTATLTLLKHSRMQNISFLQEVLHVKLV